MAETGEEISGIAARYIHISKAELTGLTEEQTVPLIADIRSMAASLLRQDETKGVRKLVHRILGRKL